MSLHITNNEVQKQIKQLGYKGCKNCQHQIAPLRMCKWAEQGGDGRIHLICPMWDKRGEESMTREVAILIDKVKAVREEVAELEKIPMIYSTAINEGIYKIGESLDKLIAESEE